MEEKTIDIVKKEESSIEKIDDLYNYFYSPDEKDQIIPNYTNDFIPSYWQSTNPYKNNVTMSELNGNLHLTYKINMRYHLLHNSSFEIKTGEYFVKEKYLNKVRICFPKNLCSNLIISGNMCIEDDEIFKLDNFSCDAYYKNNHRNFLCYLNHEKNIGNIDKLTKPSTYLPNKNLSFSVPYFYSYQQSPPFPLILFNKETKITHNFICKKIKDMIQLFILDKKTGKWHIAHKDYIKLKFDKYIEYSRTDSNIPELISEYSALSKKELESLRCFLQQKYIKNDNKIFLNYKELIPTMEECEYNIGNKKLLEKTNANIANLKCNNLALCYHWFSLIPIYENYNIYSNYGSKLINPNSNSSILSTSYIFEHISKFSNYPNNYFLNTHCHNHFLNPTLTKDILSFALCKDPYSPNSESGVYLDNEYSYLKCSFKKKKIILNCKEYENGNFYVNNIKNIPKFVFKQVEIDSDPVLIVRILVQKKYQIQRKYLNENFLTFLKI